MPDVFDDLLDRQLPHVIDAFWAALFERRTVDADDVQEFRLFRLSVAGDECCEAVPPGFGKVTLYGPEPLAAVMIGETLYVLSGRRSVEPRFMASDETLEVGAGFDPAQDLVAVGWRERAEALPEQQGVFVTVSGGIEDILPDEPVANQVERSIRPDA